MRLASSSLAFPAIALALAGCTQPAEPAPAPTDPTIAPSEPAAPTVPSPRISDVVVAFAGDSSQVRQGAGSVRIEVLGQDLANVSRVALGPYGPRVMEQSDRRIVLDITVAADHALGTYDLEMSNGTSHVTWPDALEVTHLTAAPDGNDVTGRGTPDRPLRSATAALGYAAPGQLVFLEAGTYDEAHGEHWPLVLTNVELRGAGPDTTVLQGHQSVTGLRLIEASTVSDLQVREFGDGISAPAGRHELERVHSVGNLRSGFLAVWLNGEVESVVVTECEFRDNGFHGFVASSGADPATFSLRDVLLEGNGLDGLSVLHDAEVDLRDATIRDNWTGIDAMHDAILTATDVVISDNGSIGVKAADDTVLDLQDVAVTGNLGHGIEFAAASLTMRDSEVLNNLGDGLRVRLSAVVDLGTSADPGNNRIGVDPGVRSSGDYLADDRLANRAQAILAYGVDLGTPEATGIHIGTWASNSPYWAFLHDGNAINFGP